MGSFTSKKCNTDRGNVSRSGFSLLEILMVLAVFVMISALAMPNIQRAYSSQQLRGAADSIRARFAKARVQAIESGDVYGFFYNPGQSDYFVAPMVQGFRSIREGVSPQVRQYNLRNNLTFAAGETSSDSRSTAAFENATEGFGAFRPILFYPDGTSQDATILLQSADAGSFVQIELRGLTGTTSASRILDATEISN